MLPARLRRLPPVDLGDDVIALEARGFRARLLGLAFLRDPPADLALLIPRCSSIHTFGMRFAIDVAFLDADRRAIRLVRAVRRNRVLRCPGAAYVIEFPVCPRPPDG